MLSHEQSRMDWRLFLRKFLQHGKRIASVSPSSRQLAQEVCRYIDPARPQTILELGAGTGAVTSVALERMHQQSTLLAVEVDAEFAHILAHRCPRADVIHADATNVYAYLEKQEVGRIDVVISGLPTPSLPQDVTRRVFECVSKFAREQYFSQITVIPWLYMRLYCRLFHEVTFKPVWWNIPCGGVYHCRYLRDDFAANLPGT